MSSCCTIEKNSSVQLKVRTEEAPWMGNATSSRNHRKVQLKKKILWPGWLRTFTDIERGSRKMFSKSHHLEIALFLVKMCILVLDLSWNLSENLEFESGWVFPFGLFILIRIPERPKRQGFDSAPMMSSSKEVICINPPLKSPAQLAGVSLLMTSYAKDV